MRFYFLRHADAHVGMDDASRPLSEKGIGQCAQVGMFCCDMSIAFDAVFTSPLRRARETADLVLGVSNKDRRIKPVVTQALLNETAPSRFSAWLDSLAKAEHILLVGHEPSISTRARHLLGIPRPESFYFPKAGLACLKTEDLHRATLKFFISPKSLPRHQGTRSG